MERIISKFVIFYRELPSIIETLVKNDGKMTMVKDGIKAIGDQKAPRITLNIIERSNIKPQKRISELEAMLDRLESNNQIIGYKKVK